MVSALKMSQNPQADFQYVFSLIEQLIPFTFIRFSDGEMEVIFNTKLIISEGSVEWRGRKSVAGYPTYDNKSFLPERDLVFRRDLIEAAKHRGARYFKGIRTQGTLATRDKEMMLELNGGSSNGLTFSDLLINENWKSFTGQIMPLILERGLVTFFGNYRARPQYLCSDIQHLKIGDNFIPNYEQVLKDAMVELLELPKGSTVLSSASSLTNIVGHRLFVSRPDLTFIDVGTALNPYIGLEEGLREYHSQSLPWSLKTLKKKALYYLFGSHRMKW